MSSSSSSIDEINMNVNVQVLFQTITSMVQNSFPPLPLSDDIKLQLYGLYKRSTVGRTIDNDSTSTGESVEPPSKWNFVAYRKYQAWEGCNDLSVEESMVRYVEVVSSLDCDLGRECRVLLEEFYDNEEKMKEEKEKKGKEEENDNDDDRNGSNDRDSNDKGENNNSKNDSDKQEQEEQKGQKQMQDNNDSMLICTSSSSTSASSTSTSTDTSASASIRSSSSNNNNNNHNKVKTKVSYSRTSLPPPTPAPPLPSPNQRPSLVTKIFGLKPFLPRGQLDITTVHLLTTLFKTLMLPLPFINDNTKSTRYNIHLQEEISKTWKEHFLPSPKNHNNGNENDNDNDNNAGRKQSYQNYSIIPALSVRSLLDLYLTAKSYPIGSEVIIVPPISIEGMVDVMQYHGINIIPIDIDSNGGSIGSIGSTGIGEDPVINVNIEKVRAAITCKTVSVLIVHPFGLVCMDECEMRRLREVVDEECSLLHVNSNDHGDHRDGGYDDDKFVNKIEIWEDCAECFTAGAGAGARGNIGYSGSPHVDVQFFSFGTIKTATALGGGIAVLKDDGVGLDVGAEIDNNNDNDYGSRDRGTTQRQIIEKMNRLQQMTYEEQTTAEYFMKICKASILHFLSRHLIILGIILRFMDFRRIDYDDFVTSAVKGFPVAKGRASCKTTKVSSNEGGSIEQKKLKERTLIQKLRKRPCSALLSLLHQRLQQSNHVQSTINSRITRCTQMNKILKQNIPSLKVPVGSRTSQHLFWLFPFIVDDPESICKYMKKRGFDVPRGTSQLGCVTSFSIDPTHASSCPNTEQMMNKILYLPVASTVMTKSEMQKLTFVLRGAMQNNKDDENGISNKDSKHRGRIFQFISYFVAFLILDRSMACTFPYSSGLFELILWCFKVLVPWFSLLTICLAVCLHLMRTTIGEYYVNYSNAFAKYNSIFCESSSTTDHETDITALYDGSGLKGLGSSDSFKQSNEIFQSESLLLPDRRLSSSHGTDNLVLLTGATGFIGSLLLRDLLLNRSQLCINGVVLICRSKRNMTASQRVDLLLENPMFSFLSNQEKQDLVIVIEGDVAAPNIGMTKSDMKYLCQDLHITHVFNCAACVNFTEPLEIAAESNITSALQVQQLTKNLKFKGALYIYLSTAFIHGGRNGTTEDPLPEELFDFRQYSPLELYESMMTTQSCASKAMNDLGFPNTYTFSKSICEHLLVNEKNVQTIIVRPSIVGPSIKEPSEGWAGDKPSTLVAGACLFLKNPYNLWTFRHCKAPVIPVDVVCRFVLKKAFQRSAVPALSKSDDESSKSSEGSSRSSELSYVFTRSSTMYSCISETELSQNSSEETVDKPHNIFTAAWDMNSPERTGFIWYNFAFAIVQLSAVNGHVELSIVYLVLLLSFRMFLSMNLKLDTYRRVHRFLVHGPLHVARNFCRLFRLSPKILCDMEKLSPFLDLPLLFFPFTTSTFHFKSELVAPASINGERYMVSCILAAERFIKLINQKMEGRKRRAPKTISDPNPSPSLLIAGKRHNRHCSDIWWALNQPKGNYAIRLVGLIMSKILRLTTNEVTIDMISMAKLARAIEQSAHESSDESTHESKPYIILAPTHRSFYDFMILSFISFSIPEIGISIPNIAAADDFARIPLLGWCAKLCGAFFLCRGKGVADPGLRSQISSLKNKHSGENPTCIEVFLEGKRSRDRRFVKPKTGFLRCLNETGGKHLIVPITINYEAIPDQSSLAMEGEGQIDNKMSMFRLFSWIMKAHAGKINLGRIHVLAADPILMEPSPKLKISEVARIIQKNQQRKVYVSNFHIETSVNILNVNRETVERALKSLGCPLWTDQQFDGLDNSASLSLPTSIAEKWTIFLQFGHIFSPFLQKSHPGWAMWLNPSDDGNLEFYELTEDVQVIVKSLITVFEEAELVVQNTLELLYEKGFSDPSSDHIKQYAYEFQDEHGVPVILINAAVSMVVKTTSSKTREGRKTNVSSVTPLFRAVRETSAIESQLHFKNIESFGAWGYKDSKFVASVQSDGKKCVTMNGNRYGISGRPMPNLIPFLERETKTRVDIENIALPCNPDISIAECDLTPEDIKLLLNEMDNEEDRVSTTSLDRARHGTGHSQEDMYAIRSHSLAHMRLPDVVVFPNGEDEVQNLISLAARKGWCLIPFGGGTNVSHATWCPSKDVDPRPMVSVDMRLMNRVLKINVEDSTVHVQAGITGGQLVREMHSLGFTIGHEPDSIEFSTLGGWIATNSSGMKQNKYGNIEDIVKEVRVVNPHGMLWQHSNGDGASFARVSTGTSLTSLVLGSEGSLGIITSAVLKICPLPVVKEYQSVLLHNFDDGMRFVKDVAKLGAMKPSSIRLLDNTQFRLGQAMKWNNSIFHTLKSSLMKSYANLKAGKFLPHDTVCATITFEGSTAEIDMQQKHIKNLALKHGGLCAGSEIGRAGYDMTYAIAYIRDFAMTYGFLAESFETFVPWSKVANMIIATKNRLRKEHSERALPGRPIVTCRITQLYDEGVCVYFYFCMNFKNVNNPSEVFSAIELAARKEILSKGGSLSHHHGVGKAKAALMDHVNSKDLKNVFTKIKEALDPDNIFGVRNGSFA